MGSFGDFFNRIGSIPACVIGALLGFGAGIFVLIFGFFPFLLLILLTLGGFIIGKMIDEDVPIVSSLKNIFSGRKSSDDIDNEFHED